MILGDFNIHWDNKANHKTKGFSSPLDSFGLVQHVTTTTHIAGNILDFVISRESDQIIRNCFSTKFISNHNAVVFYLVGDHPHSKRKEIVYKKIHSIDATVFQRRAAEKLWWKSSLTVLKV